MRRFPFLLTRCLLFGALLVAIGCHGEPMSRSQATSPKNFPSKNDSAAAQAAIDQRDIPAVDASPDKEQVSSSGQTDLRTAATQRTSGAEHEPETAADVAEQIVELLESAKYKSQTDDGTAADADYRQAGELAARLLALRPELTRQELRIAAIASYFQARALAKGLEPQQALAAIERAFAAGFEDLERLNQDAELSSVRALPEFDAFRAALEARLTMETRNQIQQQIQEFDPYLLEFRLPNLEGTEIASAEFQGKVVVLTFWGTWCVKCQAEVPALNRIQTAYGERGVQVVGVSYEEAEDNAAAVERIRKFQESHPLEYLCLLGDETTRDQVRPPDDAPPEWVFPVTLILDRQGRVRLHFAGEVSYIRLEAAVQSLLEGV